MPRWASLWISSKLNKEGPMASKWPSPYGTQGISFVKLLLWLLLVHSPSIEPVPPPLLSIAAPPDRGPRPPPRSIPSIHGRAQPTTPRACRCCPSSPRSRASAAAVRPCSALPATGGPGGAQQPSCC
ncbi:unnamed protein product [Urochloa humidicola]